MKRALHQVFVSVTTIFTVISTHGQSSEFRQTSIPAGIVNQATNPATGSSVQTVTAPNVSGAFTFTEWTLNGVRVEDFSGGAANPARFTINTNTDAVAIYLPTSDDLDEDGLPDWWERRFFGNLSPQPTDNTDADMLTHSEEIARGQNPRVPDDFEIGGISRRRSAQIPVFSNPVAYFFLRETSDPPGALDSTRAVPTGVPVALTLPPVTNSGSRFTGWMENGTRLDNGIQVQPISITLTADRHLIARYIPESLDSDADMLADWQEMLFFESLANDLSSDSDGDSFSIEEENLRGISLVAADLLAPGGISRRRSSLFFADSTGQLPYRINSSPATIQDQLTYHPSGTRVSAPDLKGHTFANYRFAWWTLNGLRMADSSGAGVSTFSFDLNAASTATAHYIDPSLDTDSDGIFDILEWIYFGNLSNGPDDDPDADQFNNSEEILRGQSVAAADTLALGGISRRRSELITTDRTGQLKYRLTSSPVSIVEETQYHPSGTLITVPSREGDQQANYRFAWYSLNGSRINCTSGAAAYTFVFTLNQHSTVVAHYLDSTTDSDSDGIADWIEIVYFDTLANNETSDVDGDSFSLSEEIARSQSPASADELEPGGISRRRSSSLTFEPLLVAEPARIGYVLAVQVGTTSATLSALINPMSAATQATFEYGLTPSYGSNAISESILNGFSAAPMIATISGLSPDTEYHFRATATNAMGTSVSQNGTFRTLPGISQYEIWRIFYAVGGAEENFDHDAYNNLLEFVLGGDPNQTDPNLVLFELDDFYLHISSWRSHAALSDGYSTLAEWSTALNANDWSTSGVITTVLIDDGEFQWVQHSIPRDIHTRLFGRIRITQPAP